MIDLDKYKNYIIIASDDPIRIENVKKGTNGVMAFKGHVSMISEIQYPPKCGEFRVEAYEVRVKEPHEI